MKAVRQIIFEKIQDQHKIIAAAERCVHNLQRLLIKLPLPLRTQEVQSAYWFAQGKAFALSNKNDQVRGLAGKVASWLGTEHRIDVQSTGQEPAQGTNYFEFDLGDGFRLDVDCKHRVKPGCETVRVRYVAEKTITVCGELPEGYERVEDDVGVAEVAQHVATLPAR